MRHKRTINLYDEDDAHRDVLAFLEQFSGDTRQKQVLVQMCLIGHRVMAYQESGEQAWFSVRNPDAAGLARRKAPQRLPASKPAPRTYEGEGYPSNEPHKPSRRSGTAVSTAPTQADEPAEVAQPVERPVEQEIVGAPHSALEKDMPSIVESSNSETISHELEPEILDLDDEFNALKILQQAAGSR